MPGFGSGPFGRDPFGEWGWSRNVLFESMPENYKRADVVEGDVLRKYVEGQQPSFTNILHLTRDFDTLRDPFTVRAEFTDYEYVTLGKQVLPVGTTEQAGALGVVGSVGTFTAQDRTAKFVSTDIGKQLFIRRSNVQANNQQTFTITSVLNDKEVYTDPVISVDAGPMRWELRSQATLPEGEVEVELRGGDPTRIELGWLLNDGAKQYDVVSRQMYWQSVTSNKLLNEREGEGYLLRAGTANTAFVYAPTYNFQYSDVGKTLCIVDESNPKNTGLWEIADVQSLGPTVAILGKLSLEGTSNNFYGKVEYYVQATADRLVTVAHVYDPQANLPLELSYDLTVPGRFDITVRLATDVQAVISTYPPDIETAIAADTVISKYVLAVPTVPFFSVVTVAEQPRVAIKTCPEASQNVPVFWSMRGFPRVVLQGDLPLGVIDGEGFDLSIDAAVSPSSMSVTSPSAPFRPGDVGKLLTINGSALGGNGCYRIEQVVNATTVVIAGYTAVEPLASLYWTRRTAPRLTTSNLRLNPLKYEVQANAQPLIDNLAYDFGIKVDSQQVETRQRAWVRQVSQWTAIKGTEDSIRAIANLSGFDCSVTPLFSIPAHPAMPVGVQSGYFLFFIGDGRSAATGSLTQVGADVVFSDTALTFTTLDVGKVIVIAGAANANNNNYFVIKQFVSASSVVLWPLSVGGTFGTITPLTPPDGNNGALLSTVGEIFTDTAPSFPAYDDLDVDYLAVLCDLPQPFLPDPPGGAPRPRHNTDVLDRPGIDIPCEAVPVILGNQTVIAEAMNSGTGDLITVVTSSGTTHTLTVLGDSLSIFKGGNWKLTDKDMNEFYLDQPPTLLASGGPVVQPATAIDSSPYMVNTYPAATYQLVLESAAPPVLGEVAFTYLCDAQPSCEICATYKVVIQLTANQILDEGNLANENAFQRCINLIQEALPAHVVAVYELSSGFSTRRLLTGITATTEVTTFP